MRKGAISPFYDNTVPTVATIQLLTTGGGPVDASSVSGMLDVQASVYDTPPIAPPAPWDVARLAPDEVGWTLTSEAGPVVASGVSVSFQSGLPINDLYDYVYAAGSYQNKPHRPGQYVYWVEHALDTTVFPNGFYTLEVGAVDTRNHVGHELDRADDRERPERTARAAPLRDYATSSAKVSWMSPSKLDETVPSGSAYSRRK